MRFRKTHGGITRKEYEARKGRDGKGVIRMFTQEFEIPMIINDAKPGRNDPCPCGRKDEKGKPVKYKNCCLHGRILTPEEQTRIDEAKAKAQTEMERRHAVQAAMACGTPEAVDAVKAMGTVPAIEAEAVVCQGQ
jgi:hypothetical protein